MVMIASSAAVLEHSHTGAKKIWFLFHCRRTPGDVLSGYAVFGILTATVQGASVSVNASSARPYPCSVPGSLVTFKQIFDRGEARLCGKNFIYGDRFALQDFVIFE